MTGVSNILKFRLVRVDLHCIGVIILNEYNKYIEKYKVLERLFQKIFVTKFDIKNIMTILKGLKGLYKLHNNVYIIDVVIVVDANLLYGIISNYQLPDKDH